MLSENPIQLHLKGNQYAHWYYPYLFNPEDYYGFIYRVTFLWDGRQYIGKKSFHKHKGTKRVGESDWLKYTTSSTDIKDLIKEYGMEAFFFEIIQLCCTKGCWSYAENNYMHKLDVLSVVDDVTGLRKYFNKQIGAIRWIPKDCNAIKDINDYVGIKSKERVYRCPS